MRLGSLREPELWMAILNPVFRLRNKEN